MSQRPEGSPYLPILIKSAIDHVSPPLQTAVPSLLKACPGAAGRRRLLPSCQAIDLSLASGLGIAMQMGIAMGMVMAIGMGKAIGMGIAMGMGKAMGMGRLRPVLMCPYLTEMHNIQQK